MAAALRPGGRAPGQDDSDYGFKVYVSVSVCGLRPLALPRVALPLPARLPVVRIHLHLRSHLHRLSLYLAGTSARSSIETTGKSVPPSLTTHRSLVSVWLGLGLGLGLGYYRTVVRGVSEV